jgi:hypothetical protein
MHYKIFLITILLLSPFALRAQDENSRYRVEILVLTHLGHDKPPEEITVLRDYSDALDFLTPPPEEEADASEDGEAAVQPEPAASADGNTALEAPEGEEALEEPVCSVVHVPEMGPEMQEAWRRLRLSGPFRPLQYLAWEQPGAPPFPDLRIHDLETVMTEDPWQAWREPEPGEPAAIVAGDTLPMQSMDEGPDTESAFEGPLPSPIRYFRLDGKVQLVRTRFLHLDVTVEWREPVYDPAEFPAAPLLPEDTDPESGAKPQPDSFLVHRLAQRRQVKTGRMEYFDGPVLGVLAFVTDISDLVEEEAPASP